MIILKHINNIKMSLKSLLQYIIKPHGKFSFVNFQIPQQGKVLDVGCGNNSPQKIKKTRPDLYYIGLDIGIYNQKEDMKQWANETILTTPEHFHLAIGKYNNFFDAVISAHNLEHCNKPDETLLEICNCLKINGLLYLSFPCEASVNFPSRKGSLNFHDDKTHAQPPSWEKTIQLLEDGGLKILKKRRRYRPLIPFIAGLCFEPFSRVFNVPCVGGGTWALYGFESVIIAQKSMKKT
jgi:SAM-dependent methyltransferase